MRKILVVDDHRLFLDGMCHLLRQLGSDVEIFEAASAQEAIDRIDRGERFTLTLVDLAMPGIDGLSFLQSLRERKIFSPVVVVSGSEDRGSVKRAFQNGAMGFIPKNTSADEMLAGLKKVLCGEAFVPRNLGIEVSDILREKFPEDSAHPESAIDGLGQRQYQVLELMNQGLPNKKIASVLHISEATVKYHIGILFRALNVRSRTACIIAGQKSGLLSSDLD